MIVDCSNVHRLPESLSSIAGDSPKVLKQKIAFRRRAFVGPWYLYLTAAMSGAAVMILEVLGAHMLAPYMGTSHFVWSAQIIVTLFALALGYYTGGYVADRTRSLSPLYAGILLAAGYLLVPARLREPLAYWSMQFDLAFASVLTATVPFFVASIQKTLLNVFHYVIIHSIDEKYSGVYFVASEAPLVRSSYRPDWNRVHECCREMTKRLFEKTITPEKGAGMVLTDDYNPMPFFDAKRRESLRRHFAMQVHTL
jgi:hypothetical protein